MKRILKIIALAGALALCLLLTGCYQPPDEVNNGQPAGAVTTSFFNTLAQTATVAITPDNIVVIEILNHAHLVESALHKSLGRDPTVLAHDLFFERAGVAADAARSIAPPRRGHDFPDLIGTSDIAGIDPDLVGAVFHSQNSHAIVEMNIRDKGDMDPFFDLADRGGCLSCGACAADDLAAGLLQPKYLGDSCLHIFCRCICH